MGSGLQSELKTLMVFGKRRQTYYTLNGEDYEKGLKRTRNIRIITVLELRRKERSGVNKGVS
jgi:hypothetical protein